MPQPTVGQIVHYSMSADDITRAAYELSSNPPDRLAQFNEPRQGQVYAAVVTSVTDHPQHPDVNLRVFLDGPYDFFAPSRTEGTAAGSWSWPEGVR